MEWYISIDSCNDAWQRQIYQSAFEQGANSFRDAVKNIHFWETDEDTLRCVEDHQLWPCPTFLLVADEQE